MGELLDPSAEDHGKKATPWLDTVTVEEIHERVWPETNTDSRFHDRLETARGFVARNIPDPIRAQAFLDGYVAAIAEDGVVADRAILDVMEDPTQGPDALPAATIPPTPNQAA